MWPHSQPDPPAPPPAADVELRRIAGDGDDEVLVAAEPDGRIRLEMGLDALGDWQLQAADGEPTDLVRALEALGVRFDGVRARTNLSRLGARQLALELMRASSEEDPAGPAALPCMPSARVDGNEAGDEFDHSWRGEAATA